MGEGGDKLQPVRRRRPCRGRDRGRSNERYHGGRGWSQHGICSLVLCGRHPHRRPLPPRLLAPQDPSAPPPLCHLHSCHGNQRLPPSCGVRMCLLSSQVVKFTLLSTSPFHFCGNNCSMFISQFRFAINKNCSELNTDMNS